MMSSVQVISLQCVCSVSAFSITYFTSIVNLPGNNWWSKKCNIIIFKVKAQIKLQYSLF